ncbi:MAG: alanyl-tRNA editing protein [Oscillospiraceae bacterium]|nr:alanyl-tRNA editing protein [Oscillospiraceae bacterium]
MATEKLYYADAYLKTFAATVLSCEAAKNGYIVTLDRTAFYPEGGGQPADHGALNGVAVTDVHEKDSVVLHTCAAALEVGSTVHGEIDWVRRFDHMQQHSGEHIVSGMLCEAFHCDNVGFHMGADVVTIDYNADMTWEDVLAVEARANQYLWENHPFVVTYPSAEELAALEYRSKKELTGQVRIASFPGADTCACCGTHVAHSGEVGLVKFLSCQKFRSGVRLELLCGKRALDYLSRNWEQNHAVGQALSVKGEKTFAAVQRLQTELADAKARAATLEEESFRRTAAEYQNAGDVLLVLPPLQGDGVRRLCDAVSLTCGGRCAVFSGEGSSYKYAVIHSGQDIRQLVKDLNAALNGRGGGRDGFAQGSVQAGKEEIQAFFDNK